MASYKRHRYRLVNDPAYRANHLAKKRASYLRNREARLSAVKKWRLKNKKLSKTIATQSRENAAQRNMNHIIAHLRANPCVDCGERDIDVLEFDHVRGTKKFGICQGKWGALSKLAEEIAKCEVRCANCHRRVTRKRGGFSLRTYKVHSV